MNLLNSEEDGFTIWRRKGFGLDMFGKANAYHSQQSLAAEVFKSSRYGAERITHAVTLPFVLKPGTIQVHPGRATPSLLTLRV
ncbi:hypothetical protein KXW99_001259 [Aspergillus fumigatus]|nr:hypothetical protein KXW99_001259 [Aspergillus fumigatus]